MLSQLSVWWWADVGVAASARLFFFFCLTITIYPQVTSCTSWCSLLQKWNDQGFQYFWAGMRAHLSLTTSPRTPSFLLFVEFLWCRIDHAKKMVHMKENGLAIRINLRYFLSLSDHYIKSYSCFGVEHHVFALKCHPLSEPLEHAKNSNCQNSVNIQSWDFIYFSWKRHNKADILAPSDQPISKPSSFHKSWNFTHFLN